MNRPEAIRVITELNELIMKYSIENYGKDELEEKKKELKKLTKEELKQQIEDMNKGASRHDTLNLRSSHNKPDLIDMLAERLVYGKDFSKEDNQMVKSRKELTQALQKLSLAKMDNDRLGPDELVDKDVMEQIQDYLEEPPADVWMKTAPKKVNKEEFIRFFKENDVNAAMEYLSQDFEIPSYLNLSAEGFSNMRSKKIKKFVSIVDGDAIERAYVTPEFFKKVFGYEKEKIELETDAKEKKQSRLDGSHYTVEEGELINEGVGYLSRFMILRDMHPHNRWNNPEFREVTDKYRSVRRKLLKLSKNTINPFWMVFKGIMHQIFFPSDSFDNLYSQKIEWRHRISKEEYQGIMDNQLEIFNLLLDNIEFDIPQNLLLFRNIIVESNYTDLNTKKLLPSPPHNRAMILNRIYDNFLTNPIDFLESILKHGGDIDAVVPHRLYTDTYEKDYGVNEIYREVQIPHTEDGQIRMVHFIAPEIEDFVMEILNTPKAAQNLEMAKLFEPRYQKYKTPVLGDVDIEERIKDEVQKQLSIQLSPSIRREVFHKDFYEDKVKSNDLVFSNGKILQEGEHVQFSTQGSGILEGKVLEKIDNKKVAIENIETGKKHIVPINRVINTILEGDIETSEESLGGDDEAFYKEWDDLNPDEKCAIIRLGFDKDTWDINSMDKSWDELSDDEKSYLAILGMDEGSYTEYINDKKSLNSPDGGGRRKRRLSRKRRSSRKRRTSRKKNTRRRSQRKKNTKKKSKRRKNRSVRKQR